MQCKRTTPWCVLEETSLSPWTSVLRALLLSIMHIIYKVPLQALNVGRYDPPTTQFTSRARIQSPLVLSRGPTTSTPRGCPQVETQGVGTDILVKVYLFRSIVVKKWKVGGIPPFFLFLRRNQSSPQANQHSKCKQLFVRLAVKKIFGEIHFVKHKDLGNQR